MLKIIFLDPPELHETRSIKVENMSVVKKFIEILWFKNSFEDDLEKHVHDFPLKIDKLKRTIFPIRLIPQIEFNGPCGRK